MHLLFSVINRRIKKGEDKLTNNPGNVSIQNGKEHNSFTGNQWALLYRTDSTAQ